MIRRYKIELLVVLFLQLGFLIAQLFYHNYFLKDSHEYVQTAENIFHEGMVYCGDATADIDPALFTKRMPAYPVLLGLFAIFTKSMIPVLIIQMVLSLAAFLCILKIFKPFGKERILLIVSIFFFPAQFIFSNLIMPEILLQFILMLLAFTIYFYLKSERLSYLWFYQTLIIAAVLIKPEFYVFVFPNILLFSIYIFKTKQRLAIISSLAPLVFLIILGGINQQRTGYFHISSIRQQSIVDESLVPFLIYTKGEEKASLIKKEILSTCAKENNFAKSAKCLSSTAIQYYREDISGFIKFRADRIIHFFLEPGISDISNFFMNKGHSEIDLKIQPGKEHIKTIVTGLWRFLVIIINVLKVFGLLFFLFNKSFRFEFRLFLFFAIGVISIINLPFGTCQFMVPVFFLITGASVFQYGHWLEMIFTRTKVKSGE